MLLIAERTDLTPAAFVAQHADVFVVFDARTQDSGNVSYGVRVGEVRLFVKTAGSVQASRAFLSHDDRVELLRNAIRLRRSVSNGTLPALRNVVESSEGPVLVYEWLEGELIGGSSSRRVNPASPFTRFLALPWAERAAALDVVFRLHVELAGHGWVACDFYDGCFIYDFLQRQMRVIDLDHYRDSPFINQMGRMFGSTRFMAPEEHELGARIDERTTVFALGRTLQQFVAQGTEPLASRACEPNPRLRFGSVREFYQAWCDCRAALEAPHAG